MNLRFALITLAVRNLNNVGPAIKDLQAIVIGPEWVADRAEPTKALIDKLYPLFDDVHELMTTATPMSAEQFNTVYAEHKATVIAAGIDWTYFVTVVIPLAQKLYELIRDLQSGQPLAT